MKHYDSYKESGTEWIGYIPNSWEETRLKYIGNLYGGLTGKSGEDFKQDDNPNNKPYIPYTNIFRNTYISKNHVDYVVLEDGENQNKVQKFDLFFLMSSETYQDLGKPCILIEDIEELYLNSFCKGFRVNRIDVNQLFLNYQLLGSIHKELISIEGRGFTRINLRQDRLNETPIFLPPLFEQEQIVSYLDEKTGLIDKLIKCIEHKIQLLKEKRLSLIEKVIHDNDIERVRLKYLVDLINRPVTEYETTNYTRIGMYNWGRGIFKYEEEIGSELGDSDFSFIKEGDLILSGQFSWEGSVSLVENEFDNCIVSHRFHILNGKDDVLLNEYLWGYFTSQEGHFLLDINSNGFAGRNRPLNIGKLLKEKIPIPRLEIQNEIKNIVEIERMNKKYSDKLINLLQEYRKSLISEVVTGKLKVVSE
jgi:type I restriction enzyme S subunit